MKFTLLFIETLVDMTDLIGAIYFVMILFSEDKIIGIKFSIVFMIVLLFRNINSKH